MGRIIGYDEIPVGLVRGAIPPAPPRALRELREQVSDGLAAAGMQEVITYSLTTLEAIQRVVSPEALVAGPPLRVANPMSSEHECLRPTLRASLLRTLAANQRQREGPLALYEVARVYLSQGRELPREPEHAAGVVSGRRLDRGGHVMEEDLDFFDAKGYLEHLFGRLGVKPAFDEGEEYALMPGRTARIMLGERAVGVLGQVDPRVAAGFDIDGDVFLFELVLDEVLAALSGREAHRYEPVPRFPPVVQDMAVVVDEAVTAAQVQAIIEAAALVRRAQLFDVYTGEPVPAGQEVARLLRHLPVAGAHPDRRGGGPRPPRHRRAPQAPVGRHAAGVSPGQPQTRHRPTSPPRHQDPKAGLMVVKQHVALGRRGAPLWAPWVGQGQGPAPTRWDAKQRGRPPVAPIRVLRRVSG